VVDILTLILLAEVSYVCINDKEGRAQRKFLNLGPQLPCYATVCVGVCLCQIKYSFIEKPQDATTASSLQGY